MAERFHSQEECSLKCKLSAALVEKLELCLLALEPYLTKLDWVHVCIVQDKARI